MLVMQQFGICLISEPLYRVASISKSRCILLNNCKGMDSFLIFHCRKADIAMFPALFETSNKTYTVTLKKPFTNIILGSDYNMLLAKNQAI